MKQQRLESQDTFVTELYYLLLAAVVGFIVGNLAYQFIHSLSAAWLLGGAVIVSGLLAIWWQAHRFKQNAARHQIDLATLAANHNWQLETYQALPALPPDLDDSSLLLIADREAGMLNYLRTTDWNYIDLSYAIYRRTRNGEYRAAHAYCSVLVTRLPRIMPNVFFDSKAQGGRQYKAKFDDKQRHSLEGDFDTYFDTYFATDYTIDSMSFVTPDVMLALEAANEYDIEIIGDRLLLYGPIYLDNQQLVAGAAKLQAILHTLQVTTAAYRDERLPYAAGKRTVTPLGMQLKRRRKSTWVSFVLFMIFIFVKLIIDIKTH